MGLTSNRDCSILTAGSLAPRPLLSRWAVPPESRKLFKDGGFVKPSGANTAGPLLSTYAALISSQRVLLEVSFPRHPSMTPLSRQPAKSSRLDAERMRMSPAKPCDRSCLAKSEPSTVHGTYHPTANRDRS